jgi:hypothetical protein
MPDRSDRALTHVCIVLVVSDEAALHATSCRLHDMGLAHHLVREPDPPFDGAATAIGVVPIDARDRRLRWAIARLPLLP